MKLNNRKIGMLRIGSDVLTDEGSKTALSSLFSVFLPFRAEYKLEWDAFEYVGFCDQFREILSGANPPLYAPSFRLTIDDRGARVVSLSDIKEL